MSDISDAPLPFSGGRLPESDDEMAFVKRRVLRFYIVAPVISAALILVGFEYDWRRVAAGGVIGLALTALSIGEMAIRERRLILTTPRTWGAERTRYVIYEGFAAIPFGFSMIVGGVCLLAPAILYLQGSSLEAMRAQVVARPGYVLAPIGVLLLSYGMGFVIGFVDRPGSAAQRVCNVLVNAPARLGGLILLFWGGLALAIGLYEWLAPEAFAGWVDEIRRGHLPFGL